MLAPKATAQGHNLQVGIVYGVDYQSYLILFALITFASERQSLSRGPPSPAVFLQISTHFTATPEILPPLQDSRHCQFKMLFRGLSPGLSHLA